MPGPEQAPDNYVPPSLDLPDPPTYVGAPLEPGQHPINPPGISRPWDEQRKDLATKEQLYQRSLDQSWQPIYGEGYHPPETWMQDFFMRSAGRQMQGFDPPGGPVDGFIQGRLGYLPTYWEDPQRIGKWFHKMQLLPASATPPSWIDKDKLTAAYKYFEKVNEGTPWWDWKFLHPEDPGRQFLQSFETPPPEALYPEELLYTPGENVMDKPLAGPPLPGSAEWEELDIWQKVMVSVFGQGPSILEPYPIERGGILGSKLRSGLASFGRGFVKGAPLGAGIGFFTAGPAGVLGGGLITGLIGGASEVGLQTIQARRAQDQSIGIDGPLEYMLENLLGTLNYFAENAERVIGVGAQLQSSMQDPDKYGPVSEVFGGLEFKMGEGAGETDWLPYIAGDTGQAASLAYETAVGGQMVITHGLEYLSYALSHIPFLAGEKGVEEIQLQRPDEIWDLGGTEPRKIGPNTPDTAAAVWKWALTSARRELMETDMAPRDAVLSIGSRFGISGILSDLFLQSLLDPLNFTPKVELAVARGAAKGKGVGGRLAKILGIGADEQAALARAIEIIERDRIGVTDIRGIKSALKAGQYHLQKGGREVISTFANVLRTDIQLGQMETVSGMSGFARFLGGVTPEGTLKIAAEPTGIFGRMFGLTPKARATKFVFTSNDVIKLIMSLGDSPEAILKMFDSMATGNAADWQKAGLAILGTPDGHYPVLAARDFKVEKLYGFLEQWREATPQRALLNQVSEMFGHEDVRQTTRMLRDYGDASWGKLTDAIARGVAEGNEQAIGLSQAVMDGIFTQTVFEDALAGSLTGKIPLTLDHFRYQVYDAWLTHVSEWVIKSFNVKLEPSLYRLSNALKQGASIVLLDGNPGYLYANFWNNISTAAIDGNLGFRSIDHIVNYFEDTLGLSPSRLEQAFGGPSGAIGEAGLVPRGEIAGLTLPEAIAKGVSELDWVKAREVSALQAISEKTLGQGAIRMIDDALGGLRQKAGQEGPGKYSPLIMSRLSGSVERSQGANAFYKGTKSWLRRAWRREIGYDKMSPGLEAALGADLAEKIYGAVEGNLKYELIEKLLLEDGTIDANPAQFVEGVAKAMGDQYSAADIMAMLDDAEILPVLEAELASAKTTDDLHMAYTKVERSIGAYINELHTMDLISKAGEVAEAVKAGDLTGLHDTWLDLNARMAEWWTSHVIEWGNVVQEADALHSDGAGGAANALYATRLETARLEANRIMDMQTAVIDGLVEGLREAGVDVGPKYALGMRLNTAEWRSFFETRDLLWKEYGAEREAGTLETGRYAELVDELNGRYQLRIEDDIDLQVVMDNEIVQATAKINLRAATVLNALLEQIREHKATMYADEQAIRGAAHELWNLTTGAEAANVLKRNFAGMPTLLRAFDTLIKRWSKRSSEVTTKDLRSFRRQVYDIWSREVKIEHIKAYYELRADGMLEVMSPDAQHKPTTAELPEQQRTTPEVEGAQKSAQRVRELAEGGEPDAMGIAETEAAGTTPDISISRDVTIDEIRALARDAGISTATRDGRPFDGHLLNALNKDLGLNDTPNKLRSLADLENLKGKAGEQQLGGQDWLRQARQMLQNRAVERNRLRQESAVTQLSVEALSTLEGGIDNIGSRKLRRIAEDNGLSEAGLMPKEAIFSWLEARRNRLRKQPIEAITPEAIKEQIRFHMEQEGFPGGEVADGVVAIYEARAKALGMTIPEFLEFRQGLDSNDIIYNFSQMEGRADSPWITQARERFPVTREVRDVPIGWLLPDGDVLRMRHGHSEIGEIYGKGDASITAIDDFLATGAVRFRVDQGFVAVEFHQVPNLAQRTQISKVIGMNKGGIVELRNTVQTIESIGLSKYPSRAEVQNMWRRMHQAAEQTTSLYQSADQAKPLYSHMSRLVDAKMPEKMAAGELLNFLLRGGTKLDELKFSLLPEYLGHLVGADPQAIWSLLSEEPGKPYVPSLTLEDGSPLVVHKSEVQALLRDSEAQIKVVYYPGIAKDVNIASIGWDSQAKYAGVLGRDIDGIYSEKSGHRVLHGTIQPEAGVGAAATHLTAREVLAGNYIDGAGDSRGIYPFPVDAENVNGWIVEAQRFAPNTQDIAAISPDDNNAVFGPSRVHLNLDEAKAFVEALKWRTDVSGDVTRWREFTYPGGENYREVVFHLPTRRRTMNAYLDGIDDAILEYRKSRGMVEEVGDYRDLHDIVTPEDVLRPWESTKQSASALRTLGHRISKDAYYNSSPEIKLAFDKLDAWNKALFGREYDPRMPDNVDLESADFSSLPHFSEPNLLGWGRMTDRTLPDGRRVILIEELQSDTFSGMKVTREQQKFWDTLQEYAEVRRQLGADAAYGVEGQQYRPLELLGMDISEFKPESQEMIQRAQDLSDTLNKMRQRNSDLQQIATNDPRPADPPLLPMEKNWYDLVVKQILRMAAEEGYDGIMLNDAAGVFQAETANRYGDYETVMTGRSTLAGQGVDRVRLRTGEGRYTQAARPGSDFGLESVGRPIGDVLDIRYDDGAHERFTEPGQIEHHLALLGIDYDEFTNTSEYYRGFEEGLASEFAEYEPYGIEQDGGQHVYEMTRHQAGNAGVSEQALKMANGMDYFYNPIAQDGRPGRVPGSMRKLAKQVGGEAVTADFMGTSASGSIDVQHVTLFGEDYRVGLEAPTTEAGRAIEAAARGKERTTTLDFVYKGEQVGASFEYYVDILDGGLPVDLDIFLGTAKDLELLPLDSPNTFMIRLMDRGVSRDTALAINSRLRDAIKMAQPHPGTLIEITDAVRDATLYEGQRLYQMGNETEIRANEQATRKALAAALKREGLSGVTLQRLLNGEDIREVFGVRAEIPEPIYKAHEIWKVANQQAQWLQSQRKMFQGPKGAMAIGKDGRAIMRFFKGADPSTALHEIGHIFRLDLLPHELEQVTAWLRKTVKEWEGADLRNIDTHEGKFLGDEAQVRAAEEAFARGFERWVAEGIAPSEGLRAVFEKFSKWLLEIYRGIKGSGIDIELSEGMRQLYSDMLGGRAPDWEVSNVTWETIGADAVARGQPDAKAPAVPGKAFTDAVGRFAENLRGEALERSVIEASEAATEAYTDADLDAMAERVYAEGEVVDDAGPEIADSYDMPSVELGGLVGDTSQAHGADPNVVYEFAYRIMDISEVTASHTIEGTESKGYPKNLQPRDRSRAASVRQSETIAAELNPAALLDPNVRIDEGAPIIGPDGLVESGNGRVNALLLAMRDYPENYAAYKQLLTDNMRENMYGDMYRYGAEQGDFPNNPILVRERLSDINRTEFAKIANESAILGMSFVEQAAVDVSKISDDMLANLIISESQTIQDALKTVQNQGIVKQFVEQSPRSEWAQLMTRDGEITRQGMDRILAAIFQYVYGKEDGTLRLAENVFESTDPVIKNITNGMMAAGGDMAKAEGLIRGGKRPAELSILNDLTAAVEQLLSLKEQGVPLKDFIDQGQLPGFGEELSPLAREILIDLEVSKRSAKAIREQLQKFARLVINEPDTGQMGLLGPHEYPTVGELWARAKEAPASTAEMFQMPEQYKNKGHYDQVPGIREGAAKSAEGYRNMMGVMDEMREQMAGPNGYTQEIRSETVRNKLTPAQQAEFKAWTKGLKQQLGGTKFSAIKWGEETRNYSLLDYTALRGIDTHFLGIPFNYAFWPTRTIARWATRFMEYPALLATYARLNEARRKQEERPGFPRRLQGKVYIPVPWMPEWMGDGLFIDPIRQFFPPHMFLDNIDRIAMDENRKAKRATYVIQKWVENGDTHPTAAQEAIESGQGELWDRALAVAEAEMESEFKDPLDYMSLVTGLALPLSIAHEVIRGTPERIQPVPLTRYTKTATSMFAQMTGIGNPEGINLEGPIRKAFDLPSYDRFEDYRVDRMLATLMAQDPSVVREALIAGQEKEGPLYDEAIRMVNSARNFGIYANPAFWIFGLGGDTFPLGEQKQRKLSEEFSYAITARELGDSTAINRFFEKYPEYEGRLASFDSQEERMRFFLVDEIWTQYRQLGSANKELVRNQLGPDFQEMFLSKETRSYADIPLEHLASWAQLMGGYVPKNAEHRIEVKPVEPLLQLPPAEAKIIDDFRDTRNKKFPNWYAVQQGYFAAGPAKSDARKNYLKTWPELEDYWDWRDDQMEGNSFLKSYYDRYDLESKDSGSLGSLGVAEIISNPILMRQLMADRYGGQSLTSGALEELRRIWEKAGGPGEFQDWVDGLDFEQDQQSPQPTGGGAGAYQP